MGGEYAESDLRTFFFRIARVALRDILFLGCLVLARYRARSRANAETFCPDFEGFTGE
jgi:hypothetical protein